MAHPPATTETIPKTADRTIAQARRVLGAHVIFAEQAQAAGTASSR